jgi:hypothetical protein
MGNGFQEDWSATAKIIPLLEVFPEVNSAPLSGIGYR